MRFETRPMAAPVVRAARTTKDDNKGNDNGEVHALLRLLRGSNKRDDIAGRATRSEREREIAAVFGQYVPKLFYSGRYERERTREKGQEERRQGEREREKEAKRR